jgi:hypothetical protein
MARAHRFECRLRSFVVAGTMLLPGCQIAPREQLEDCHRLSQTLRSENAQLKDQMLALRSQNRDYSERAVDDSRRLALQDEAIGRLEQSVQAYQDDRNRLETAFNKLRANLPASASPGSVSLQLQQGLDRLARSDPSCQFDRQRVCLSIPAETFFKPGTDELTPHAQAWLRDLGGVLRDPGAGNPRLSVSSTLSTPSWQQTNWDSSASERSSLAFKQAVHVRDYLAREIPISELKTSVTILETGTSRDLPSTHNEDQTGQSWRIEIQMVPGHEPRNDAPDLQETAIARTHAGLRSGSGKQQQRGDSWTPSKSRECLGSPPTRTGP